MHPLVILAIVALVAVWFHRRGRASPAAFAQPAVAGTDARTERTGGTHRLAFVARGKLFLGCPGEPLREVHSPHVQSVMDRLERSRQLHGWKEGTAFQVRSSGSPREAAKGELALRAASALFVDKDRLIYALRDDSTGGLFEQNLADGSERRLLHRQNLLLDDLRLDPERRRLLCTQVASNGTSAIVTMDMNGDGYRELTGGDTLDSAPSWVPGKPDLVVFQSCGIARSEQGYVLAVGPASIQLLDCAQSTLTPVLDESRWDHLQPRVSPDGKLLFIRRPYEPARRASALTDTLMFPFRLLAAIFHFLNVFALMFSRKPLTTADGPERQTDLRWMLLKGRRIDAESALRRGQPVDGVRSLVPADWQLVERSEQGQERVLATHVASFDIAPDGSVIYSNGNGIFALDATGERTVLVRDRMIAEVVVG